MLVGIGFEVLKTNAMPRVALFLLPVEQDVEFPLQQ